jgi:hypothetical protein
MTDLNVTEMSVPTNCGQRLGSSFDEKPTAVALAAPGADATPNGVKGEALHMGGLRIRAAVG